MDAVRWAIVEGVGVDADGLEGARLEVREAWARGEAGAIIGRADLEGILRQQAGDHILLLIHREPGA